MPRVFPAFVLGTYVALLKGAHILFLTSQNFVFVDQLGTFENAKTVAGLQTFAVSYRADVSILLV